MLGGIAGIYGALAYIVTMMVFLVVLEYPSITNPAEKVAMIVNDQATVIAMTWLSYILFGVFLVVLALALYERLHAKDAARMKIATVLALIWATLLIASGLIFSHGAGVVAGMYDTDPDRAVLLWQGIEVVSSALSFIDGELLGGLWMLLVGLSALKSEGLGKALCVWTAGVGIVGIISILPFLNTLSAVFGLGQIVWFVWIGIDLLRGTTRANQLSTSKMH